MARPLPNDGHKDRFGSPSGGWPQFGPDGKRIREEAPPSKPKRAPRKAAK